MMTVNITSPVHLYKYLLRCLRRLPDEPRAHYQHVIRQEYNSHSDEIYPERIQQIIDRAIKDMDWLLEKYGAKQESPKK